ncbi:MAG: hypothetical protein HQL76_05360 [Magnetococcales bacterium]|nr:hypothetical protein [Magnetococcales bacterium]
MTYRKNTTSPVMARGLERGCSFWGNRLLVFPGFPGWVLFLFLFAAPGWTADAGKEVQAPPQQAGGSAVAADKKSGTAQGTVPQASSVGHAASAPTAKKGDEAKIPAKIPQDPLHLLDLLEKRRLLLEEQTRRMEVREGDLKRLEEKLAGRIEALEKLRDAIRGDLEREKQFDDVNIARLGKIYTSMKPGAAAEGLKTLDPDTAVKVLKVMPEKVVAKILNKMDPLSAGRLADELGMPLADKRRRGE